MGVELVKLLAGVSAFALTTYNLYGTNPQTAAELIASETEKSVLLD